LHANILAATLHSLITDIWLESSKFTFSSHLSD